jgi:hypothetical protein
MKEVEYRTECATCGRVINREFVEETDNYKKKRIITTHGICRICRSKRHFNPGYDEEVAALNAEYIRRMNNLIGQRARIR